ncbi:Uncharacterised protein [Achromobacter xylosoxidans]|nr:Uncharacterised protein [Achromobacter xylosoxidans]
MAGIRGIRRSGIQRGMRLTVGAGITRRWRRRRAVGRGRLARRQRLWKLLVRQLPFFLRAGADDFQVGGVDGQPLRDGAGLEIAVRRGQRRGRQQQSAGTVQRHGFVQQEREVQTVVVALGQGGDKDAVAFPALRSRVQGEMHAAGDHGVGFQRVRRPVRFGPRQLHASRRWQMQQVKLAILRHAPGRIAAHAEQPPLPPVRVPAYRKAAQPGIALRRCGVVVAACESLIQREQVCRGGGRGAEQQAFPGLHGGGGLREAEIRDTQAVAAAVQPGGDRQPVMCAAVWVDAKGKHAVRCGNGVGRQGIGNFWRPGLGRIQRRRRTGTCLRQERLARRVLVVETQDRIAGP